MSKIIFDSNNYFDTELQILFENDIPKENPLIGIPYKILCYLANNSPSLLSKEQIFENCWNNCDNAGGDVAYHIRQIRKYIHDKRIPGTKKYTYIVERDGKYFCTRKLLNNSDLKEQSDALQLYLNSNIESSEKDTILIPTDVYCNMRGIKGFSESALPLNYLIEKLKDKTHIFILSTTGVRLINNLATNFIPEALANGTSFTILVPNKYSSFINDIADIETPYDKQLSRKDFASQFENIIKTLKREVLKARYTSKKQNIGSIFIGCTFTYLRQTITMGVENNNAWGYLSMTMPPSRTINGTPSFVFSGNIEEDTLANRAYDHIQSLIEEAKKRNSFFEITDTTEPESFNFGLEKTNAKMYWEQIYKTAQNNMLLHQHYSIELIEVAAQHPLDGGKPSFEFRSRLDYAFNLYKQFKENKKKVKIYVPGSIHTKDDVEDSCSLSSAGTQYLSELGIPFEDLFGDDCNYKYKGEDGVYNSADECFVASKIFGDGEYKNIHVICSPNQAVRKQLFYLSFGIVPLIYTVPCDNLAHDIVYELFEGIPDVIFNDHDWQAPDSFHAIRTRNERKQKK